MMNEQSEEIPRTTWENYFRSLTALSSGHSIELEQAGGQMANQGLRRRARLRLIRGFTSHKPSEQVVEIDVQSEEGLDHRILHPTHVYAVRIPGGGLQWLDFEDEDRITTRVHFDSPPILDFGPEANRHPDLLVQTYMSSNPVTLQSGSSLAQAQALFVKHRFRHLPIIDKQGAPVGLLMEKGAFARDEAGRLRSDLLVDDVMIRRPYCVESATPIDQAACSMSSMNYGCALVVDDQKVVGTFTTTDALRALAQFRSIGRRGSLGVSNG